MGLPPRDRLRGAFKEKEESCSQLAQPAPPAQQQLAPLPSYLPPQHQPEYSRDERRRLYPEGKVMEYLALEGVDLSVDPPEDWQSGQDAVPRWTRWRDSMRAHACSMRQEVVTQMLHLRILVNTICIKKILTLFVIVFTHVYFSSHYLRLLIFFS